MKKCPRMPEFRILGTQRTKFGVLRSGIQGFWNSGIQMMGDLVAWN